MTIQAQLEAIAHGALVRPLNDFATLVVTGDDRQSWLAGMVTADIKSLPPGQARYALSVKKNGRIQAEVWVCIEPERIVVGVPAPLADVLVEAMDKYLIMEDAEITRAEQKHGWWLAHGPLAQEVANAAREANAIVGLGHFGELETAVIAVREGSHPNVGELLTQPAGALLATPEGWERIRIERMLPRFGVDFEVDCYPQEACLESLAVSFNKGCYLGQEAVFMLEKRGHVAKRLVRLILEGDDPPKAGTPITTPDGKEVGAVTSAIADGGKSWVIGSVRYKQTVSGTELAIGARPATVSCLGIRDATK
jgi:folate-binding protein YgfZ